MAKGKNVGEWSELYTLATILHQGGLNAGDKYGKIKRDKFYKVLRAFIDKIENDSHREYRIKDKFIEIYDRNTKLMGVVEKVNISKQSESFLKTLLVKNKATFNNTEAEKLIKTLKVKKIKGASLDKSDVDLSFYDEIFDQESPITGFSVKSYLKSRPTLINASQSTNVNYRIVGKGFPKNLIQKDVMGNTRKILAQGFKLELHSIGDINYSNSMRYIDLNLPEYLSRLLVRSYLSDGQVSLKVLAAQEFVNDKYASQISKKIKQFLAASAVSIQPSKPWGGDLTGIGGMITVDKEGNIFCFYIYNMEDFEDFLFENTYFETASTTRYKQGSILELGGKNFYRLNIQVRFI